MGGQRRINGGSAIMEKPKNSPTSRRLPDIPPPSPPQTVAPSSPVSTKRTTSQPSVFANSRPLGVSQHTI